MRVRKRKVNYLTLKVLEGSKGGKRKRALMLLPLQQNPKKGYGQSKLPIEKRKKGI